ncbi:hypothetical protein [Arenimonas terrae]|jgi:hypothetical protein|uniref:hypothetical protein n=1 Tax=Arenimonas terrae TaxID=2546226 RepID=UPI00159EE5CE|nr:hypothetical protein [Arenimonas terrae]
MSDILESDQLRRGPWRWLVWGGAAGLLLLPLVAMQFTAEVNWDGFDFLVMGGMLLTVCVVYEIAARLARSNAYMVAAAIAIGGAFLTVWANGAVGIIGSEDNPANEIFYWVLAVEFAGALLALLRARAMAWVMVATAVAQLGACVYAWAAGLGHVWVFTGVMCALWLASARLFHQAARLQAKA